jgi:ABC-type dipeptide/oligopeptide/nickel transport system permease subunit
MSVIVEPAQVIAETTAQTRRRGFLARLSKNRVAFVSGIFIVTLVLLSLIGPTVYQQLLPPEQQQWRDGIFQDYDAINANPSALHWLGADYLGRDNFARLLGAIRISLLVAGVVELINIGFGGILGLMAGYRGGMWDILFSRLADMLFAFPGLLLAILIAAVFGSVARDVFGSTGRLLLVAAALSLVSWPLMFRFVRGETLSVKKEDYVTAAQSIGARVTRILFRHILPNVLWLVIVAATLDVASVIVNEATLSLLGLGIEEPGTSLGLMIFKAKDKLQQYPLQIFFPALTITLLVLAFSFLGDGLRDALDPTNQG